MESKAHLNVKGFLKLVSLINKLNKPLTKTTLDKLSYLGVLPNVEFEAPVLNKNAELDSNWVSGFITGEGSFTYFTRTRKNSKGDSVRDYTLAMEVSQDSKDWFILNLMSAQPLDFGVLKQVKCILNLEGRRSRLLNLD